jgi:hypothetical protein
MPHAPRAFADPTRTTHRDEPPQLTTATTVTTDDALRATDGWYFARLRIAPTRDVAAIALLARHGKPPP